MFGLFCVISLLLQTDLSSNIQFETLTKRLSNTNLIVSNEPESLKAPGLIFDGPVLGQGLRVMYHHRNISSDTFSYVILLSNLDGNVARVRVSRGEGGPSEDIVYSGHKAAFQYLNHFVTGGQEMVLEPHSTKSLVVHALKPGLTTSGLVSVEKLTSSNLSAKLAVLDQSQGYLTGFSDLSDLKSTFKSRYFQDSFREIIRDFDVRDRVELISIGGPPYVVDEGRGYVMKGNYGVMYAVSLRLMNPLGDARKVRLLFMPAKFESVDRGVMYKNGVVTETGMVVGKGNRFQAEMIDEITLSAGESRLIQWLMFPQAGCFYPVDILVKAVE